MRDDQGCEAPRWLISLADDGALERVRESLLTVADGRVGTRASTESAGRSGSEPMVVAAGVYERSDGRERVLEGPLWTDRGLVHRDGSGGWELDTRTPTVQHAFDAAGRVRGREFRRRFVGHSGASVDLARGEPGVEILRAAATHDAVLVVLGWACDLSAGHAGTIRRVLADATVPVMLLPTARA